MAVRRLSFVSLICSVAACSANPAGPPLGGRACTPNDVLDGPVASLAYPQPNATAIATNFGTVVYVDTSPVPIRLLDGGTVIATTPTALPSPLPSPIATPPNGMAYFAVAVPNLASSTMYIVQGDANDSSGCGGQRQIFEGAGDFSTR